MGLYFLYGHEPEPPWTSAVLKPRDPGALDYKPQGSLFGFIAFKILMFNLSSFTSMFCVFYSIIAFIVKQFSTSPTGQDLLNCLHYFCHKFLYMILSHNSDFSFSFVIKLCLYHFQIEYWLDFLKEVGAIKRQPRSRRQVLADCTSRASSQGRKISNVGISAMNHGGRACLNHFTFWVHC